MGKLERLFPACCGLKHECYSHSFSWKSTMKSPAPFSRRIKCAFPVLDCPDLNKWNNFAIVERFRLEASLSQDYFLVLSGKKGFLWFDECFSCPWLSSEKPQLSAVGPIPASLVSRMLYFNIGNNCVGGWSNTNSAAVLNERCMQTLRALLLFGLCHLPQRDSQMLNNWKTSSFPWNPHWGF